MPKSDKPIFEQLIFDFEDCYDNDYTVDEDENIIDEPSAPEKIYEELKALDVPSMTIMDAAQKLYELVDIAKGH